MIDIEKLNDTINYLNLLKEEEKKKDIEILKDKIKKGIITHIINEVYEYQAKQINEYAKKYNTNFTWTLSSKDYNDIEDVLNKIDVSVWEI